MQPVYIHGDNHGYWDRLFDKIDLYDLRDCILIGVGDTSIGAGVVSDKKVRRGLDLLNNRFKKRGIQYMSIRGNHCNPAYFDGSVKLSHLQLVPDWSEKNINDRRFLFVGGAISVDRKALAPNGRPWHIEGQTWWPNEVINERDLGQINKCDVLVLHAPPSCIGLCTYSETVQAYQQRDKSLISELIKERQFIDKIVNKAAPKLVVCGHHHISETYKNDKRSYRLLDIDEIWEIRQFI